MAFLPTTIMVRCNNNIDMDECLMGISNDCSRVANCKNTIGSDSCQCKPGYKGGGTNFSGINMGILTSLNATAMATNVQATFINIIQKISVYILFTFHRC